MLNSAPRGASRSSLITGRSPERFDATTVAGSPSTSRLAPLANRSSSSLACSTKKEPSSPCGLPTRPTRTRSATGRHEDRGSPALEDPRRLLARRGVDDALAQDLPCARPLALAKGLDNPLLVDRGLAQLRLAVDEERPEGGDLALVREADAARVDEADPAALPVLLHVRVAGYDDALLDPGENLCEALVRSRGGDHLVVAARCRVAEQNPVELDRRRLPLQERNFLLGETRPFPVIWLAVGVPADEARVDRAHELQGLVGLRAPGQVAPEDDLVDLLVLKVGQDRLERGTVAVHVVE